MILILVCCCTFRTSGSEGLDLLVLWVVSASTIQGKADDTGEEPGKGTQCGLRHPRKDSQTITSRRSRNTWWFRHPRDVRTQCRDKSTTEMKRGVSKPESWGVCESALKPRGVWEGSWRIGQGSKPGEKFGRPGLSGASGNVASVELCTHVAYRKGEW